MRIRVVGKRWQRGSCQGVNLSKAEFLGKFARSDDLFFSYFKCFSYKTTQKYQKKKVHENCLTVQILPGTFTPLVENRSLILVENTIERLSFCTLNSHKVLGSKIIENWYRFLNFTAKIALFKRLTFQNFFVSTPQREKNSWKCP